MPTFACAVLSLDTLFDNVSLFPYEGAQEYSTVTAIMTKSIGTFYSLSLATCTLSVAEIGNLVRPPNQNG